MLVLTILSLDGLIKVPHSWLTFIIKSQQGAYNLALNPHFT